MAFRLKYWQRRQRYPDQYQRSSIGLQYPRKKFVRCRGVQAATRCVKFLLDNCLAIRHARALNEMVEPDHSFTHLQEKFLPDTTDEEWIRTLGDEGNGLSFRGLSDREEFNVENARGTKADLRRSF